MASTVAELRKLDTANDRTLQRLTARLQTRLDKRIQNAAIFRSRMLVDMKFNTTEHREEYRQHIFAITQDIALGMAFADMIARLRLIRNAESQGEYRRIASYERLEEQAPDFLNLPFTAAIESFAAREPVLAMSAPAVTVAYQRQSFALARSTSIELTAVVQRSLGNVMKGVETYPDFVKRFRAEGLSDAYAETVFRTNLNSAQTAGRVEQASDPELRGFIVAWRYFSVRDTDTRPNHAAMDGFMASLDAPVWSVWMPPNGFSCLLPDTLVKGDFQYGFECETSTIAVSIRTASGRLAKITQNHPAFVAPGIWKRAKDVTVGDVVYTFDNTGSRSAAEVFAMGELDKDEAFTMKGDMHDEVRAGVPIRTCSLFDLESCGLPPVHCDHEAKQSYAPDPYLELQLTGAPDRVVSVSCEAYTGKVYDFDCRGGVQYVDGILKGNCRCSLIEVTRPQAKSLGRYKDGRFVDTEPRGVSPDAGFSNSPVQRIYRGVA